MSNILSAIDIDKIADLLLDFAPKLLTAILIMLGFWLLFRISRRALRSILGRSGMEQALIIMLVDHIYRFALMTFGIVMAADQVGINVGAALAGIGVIGLALGFAAQDSLSNTIAGFMIFWDKPFAVGDWISVSDHYGRVADITLRTTRIRTLDNAYIVIPNKNIIDNILTNHSKEGDLRVVVPLSIAYKEDIDRAREVLLQAVEGLEQILPEPAPSVVVGKLDDSGVNLNLRFWVADAAVECPMMDRTREIAKLALDAAAIQIPFPHMQIMVDDEQKRILAGVDN
ncbi:MAG: mechanosensitive ion channel [bacterium]|nr:mechanosensitive ion channel [bacterium]